MNNSEMECSLAKKQFYDDRTQMLSILNNKVFDSNDSEDTIKSFLRHIENKDSKLFDYDSIKDLTILHRIKLNINSLIEKDLNSTVNLWAEYKKRYLNDREDTFDSIYSDSLRFIEQKLMEKLKKLWNKSVVIDNNYIVISDKIQIDYNEYIIDDILNNLGKFPDFQVILEALAKGLNSIINKSSQFQIKIDSTPSTSKLYTGGEATPENFSQSLSAIFTFLTHRLFQLAKNQKIFNKKLNFSELFNTLAHDLIPIFSESLKNNGFSIKEKNSNQNLDAYTLLLQEIRELALHDDLQLTQILESELPNSISSVYNKLAPEDGKKIKFLFNKIRVPNSALRFIEIIYNLLTPSPSSEEILKTFPKVRTCMQLYITVKSTVTQQKSQINRFCIFYNTCKYLEYHIILINANILNNIDRSVAANLHLSDFIYKIQQKIGVSFKKLLKKFEKQVLNDFQSCVENKRLNVMKINEKLTKYEDYLKDISEIICQDSGKVIGRLLDFIIINLKTVFSPMNAEYSQLRPLIQTIRSFSRFFQKGTVVEFAKQWSVLNELDSSQDIFN